MIYYNYIDPENAKPGDLCFCKRWEGHPYNLYFCVKCKFENNIEGNQWAHIQSFGTEYESEIINNKPTPALIARFTSLGKLSACVEERKNQQLEIGCGALVKVPGGIIQISEIKEFENSYYFGTMDWCEKWDGEYLQEYAYPTKEQAETERARLIAWLEEV